jgi:hypothetical protein
MKKIAIVSAIAVAAISTVSFANAINSLKQNELKQILTDKTISSAPVITMDNHLTPNTFSGYFAKDGTINGKLANQPDNGPQADAGKYKIEANGNLCVTWDHWNNQKPICVSAYKVGNGLMLVNTESHDFENLLLSSDIKAGNQLN